MDKRLQISFFVIRFSVKYSDRLVATVALKFPNFPILEGFGICPTEVTATL